MLLACDNYLVRSADTIYIGRAVGYHKIAYIYHSQVNVHYLSENIGTFFAVCSPLFCRFKGPVIPYLIGFFSFSSIFAQPVYLGF